MVRGLSGTQEGDQHRARGSVPQADSQGQSSVIGVALIFAIVVVGLTIVAAFGGLAINDTETELSTSRAEKVMTQFDSEAALVALGGTDSRQVTLSGASDEYSLNEGAGWMKVTVTDTVTGNTTVIMNKTLGELRYDNGEAIIAYQGGGVWRKGEGDATMVSPPEFHYRNATLTVPAVSITGNGTPNDRITLTDVGTNQTYPDRARASAPSSELNFTNPLETGRVEVTVKSDYYRGWGTFFERRTDGVARYNDSRKTATLVLVSPIRKRTITSATSSLAASGNFTVQGRAFSTCNRGNDDVYTNSYNSSNGTCGAKVDIDGDGTKEKNIDTNGDVVYGNDITITDGAGSSNFNGSLVSGSNVSVATGGSGAPKVYGNINYTDSCIAGDPGDGEKCEDRIVTGSGGSVTEIDGVPTAAAIDYLVENKVDDINEGNNNDNSATAAISSNKVEFGSDDEATLQNGTYYVKNLELEKPGSTADRLILDTTGGPITIAVEGGIEMAPNATIDVKGNGTVKIYVNGKDSLHSGEWDLEMDKNAEILTNDRDATQLRIYGKRDFKAQIGGGQAGNLAQLVGVIYAPPGETGSGEVEINGGEVFGGILTGTTNITSNKGSIHYDEALANEPVISRGTKVVKITYLHISNNKIKVSD